MALSVQAPMRKLGGNMFIDRPLIMYIIEYLTAAVMSLSGQAAEVKDNAEIQTDENIPIVRSLEASTISVSCIKVTWDADKDRDYSIWCETEAGYADNMYCELRGNDMCYITGLREGSEYEITVTPEPKEGENFEPVPETVTAHTEAVEVIYEFEHEDGWTSAMAGERASGLKYQPASGAIYGSAVDPVTHTGIRRDEYGDYCVAMGLHYGLDWDRFLVEMCDGTQFTVKMCDSKGLADDGEGKYHWFGGVGNGKCIIEFIYDDNALPSCVAFSGSWGYYNWSGLNLSSNIKSIKKINYGETIEY